MMCTSEVGTGGCVLMMSGWPKHTANVLVIAARLRIALLARAASLRRSLESCVAPSLFVQSEAKAFFRVFYTRFIARHLA